LLGLEIGLRFPGEPKPTILRVTMTRAERSNGAAVQRFCNSIAAVPVHPERSRNMADSLAFCGPETFFIPVYPGPCYGVR
jgi:hypothetical protein